MINYADILSYLKLIIKNWQSGTDYTAGQSYVIRNNTVYLCIDTHTSGGSFDASKFRESYIHNAVKYGKRFVYNVTNRLFLRNDYTDIITMHKTDKIAFVTELPVNSVGGVEIFDEYTNTYSDIFVAPDNASNSTIGGDYVRLTKDYYFYKDRTYRITYNGGYDSSDIPADVIAVATEQAVLNYMQSSEYLGVFGVQTKDFGGQATKAIAFEDRDALIERHRTLLQPYTSLNI